MRPVKRRQFLKLGAVIPSGLLDSRRIASEPPGTSAVLEMGGRSTSPISGENRTPVPSTCWQCVTQCPIIGYLDKGRLVKIEGNPLALSTRGKLIEYFLNLNDRNLCCGIIYRKYCLPV